MTRALEAFERRLDAKIAPAAAPEGHRADAHAVDALRATVEGLRIELATERAARVNDVERLERECRTLREELARAMRAPEWNARAQRRVAASHARVVETRADVVAVDDDDEDDEDEDEDEDNEPERKEARPELEARRRRLRALYRELQTLSA